MTQTGCATRAELMHARYDNEELKTRLKYTTVIDGNVVVSEVDNSIMSDIFQGDKITVLNGKQITSMSDYESALNNIKGNKDDIRLILSRNGMLQILSVNKYKYKSAVKVISKSSNAEIYSNKNRDTVTHNNTHSMKAQIEKPTPAVNRDTPYIAITSPAMQRGVKLTSRESRLSVTGTVTAADGVAEVTVNGQSATLGGSGTFSAEILLRPGDNQITVTALGVNRIQATEQFTISRETGQVATLKPLTPITSGAYYALIIGNNVYRNMERLKTAVNDATAVDQTLKEFYGFQTKLLLNATRKETLSAINEFRKKLGEKDNLLIYYAGHGEFDREAGKAYWLPVDAQRDDPTEWIIADDITSSIKRLSSKHVLIVSDSCYSGTLTRSARTELKNTGEREAFLKKMTERSSRTLMASGGNEPVADDGGSGHSIFADSFLQALKEIDRPIFSADELFYHHIKSRVAGKSDQVPEYNEIRNSGHDGGDFLFVRQN